MKIKIAEEFKKLITRRSQNTLAIVSLVCALCCLGMPVGFRGIITAHSAPVSVTSLGSIAPGNIDTIIGNGVAGYSGDGGPALSAALNGPHGISVAADGTIYVADTSNRRVRRIETDGIITTIAGTGAVGDAGDGGPGVNATISGVFSVAVNPTESVLYISEIDNNRIRKLDLVTGVISNFAGGGIFSFGFAGDGGPAVNASFAFPEGVAVDSTGKVYIADVFNCRIRVVDTANIIYTAVGSGNCGYAGDGNLATNAELTVPSRMAFDENDNLFLTDRGPRVIRRVDAATGIISTVAGGGIAIPGTGPATSMDLAGDLGDLAVGAGHLYIAHLAQVWDVDLTTGILSRYAGTGVPDYTGDGGPAETAQLNTIGGLTMAPGNYLFISDSLNCVIRAVAPSDPPPPSPTPSPTQPACLPSVLGDLTITDGSSNTIDLSCVTSVTGNVSVTNNTSATTIDLGNLEVVSGNVDVTGNSTATTIDLGGLVAVSGNVTITDGSSSTIYPTEVASVGGNFTVSDGSSNTVSFGELQTVGGDVSVSRNTAATNIDLGSLQVVGGDVAVSGNTSATGIDLGELQTVGGDVNVSDNSDGTSVTILFPETDGNVTVESSGTGAFPTGGSSPDGNSIIDASGYSSVSGTTAGGNTTVSSANGAATMTVLLPTGAFATPVTFGITSIDALAPEQGTGPTGGTSVIEPIAAYQFNFSVPTLNQDASLSFFVELNALDAANRDAVLQALTSGTLTLATKGDAAGSTYQAFQICVGGQTPSADGCVLVEKLDATGRPTTNVPAVLRFSSVVGHFSVWAVVMVDPIPENSFNGLLQPYPAPPYAVTPTFRRGSVVPLKFNWLDNSGVVISSGAADPHITVFPVSCAFQAPTSPPISIGDAAESGGLRYDQVERMWIFNWSTRPLSAGCYTISVTPANNSFSASAVLFPVALRDP